MAQVGTGRTTPLLWAAAALALGAALSCHDEPEGEPLAISEVMTDNDSAWLDEAGEVEDWIEVVNSSDRAVQLSAYMLRDGRGREYTFPDRTLAAGGTLVVFADDDVSQGELHAGFKLSAGGVELELIEARTGH